MEISSSATLYKKYSGAVFLQMLTMFQLLYLSAVLITTTKSVFAPFNTAMERIVHGHVVDISDYPYQVALVAHNKHRKRIICGGAIVKPNVIFTAAHCTHAGIFKLRENLSVLVGANYLDDPKGRYHSIQKVVKHPDFDYQDFDHDFSVVVLKKPIQFDFRAQEIAISTGDHLGGTLATASGWGLTEFRTPSKHLRSAELTIESWGKCQDYFPKIFHPRITRNMICVRPSKQTTYYGDSGGPLVIDGELVGLVSFGRTISLNKKTTVFTRVKNFLKFVEDVVPEWSD